MLSNRLGRMPFSRKSANAFQKALAKDVVLEGNTLVRPIEDIDR
jgi:hypothetical protein